MMYSDYPQDSQGPVCPVCGDRCLTFYLSDTTGEILGCDNCVRMCDVFDYDEGDWVDNDEG